MSRRALDDPPCRRRPGGGRGTIEIERALALADAALADEQHADAEDVEEDGVHHRPLGQLLEHRDELSHRRGGDDSVFNSGTRARSASATTSAGGGKPPVIRMHGKSSVTRGAAPSVAAGRFQALEITDFAFAEDRTPPGLRDSWKPARARPVFRMCGLVMTRSRPSAPASSSSGRPNASGRLQKQGADGYARNGGHGGTRFTRSPGFTGSTRFCGFTGFGELAGFRGFGEFLV